VISIIPSAYRRHVRLRSTKLWPELWIVTTCFRLFLLHLLWNKWNFRNDIIKGGRAYITGILAYIVDIMSNYLSGTMSLFSDSYCSILRLTNIGVIWYACKQCLEFQIYLLFLPISDFEFICHIAYLNCYRNIDNVLYVQFLLIWFLFYGCSG
jgi:hypothetical protein